MSAICLTLRSDWSTVADFLEHVWSETSHARVHFLYAEVLEQSGRQCKEQEVVEIYPSLYMVDCIE